MNGVAPPQQHAPQGPGYPMPASRPRSSKGLVIGLGIGAVVVAGTIAGVLLARGGGGGVGSSDDLVKRTLAAVSEGDVEQLVRLSDPVGLHDLAFDCSERDKQDAAKDQEDAGEADQGMRTGGGDEAGDELDDPQLQEKRVRRKHEELVGKMKGMKIELVSIAADQDAGAAGRAKASGMKKGDQAMKGCVLKVDVAQHALVAKIRVTAPDATAPSEGEATFQAIEAGGSWFLWAPPTISAGGGADASGLAAKLRGYRDQMCACKDLACSDQVRREQKEWVSTIKAQAERLPKDEAMALEVLDEELWACRSKLQEGGVAGATGAGDAGGGDPMKAALAQMDGYKARMCACAERACAERVDQEMIDWSKAAAARTQGVKPSPDQERQIIAIVTAYAECQTKAKAADGAPKPSDPLPPEDTNGGAGPGASGGADLSSVPACAEYRRQIDQIRSCPKYPSTAVDSMQQGYELMEKSWAASRSSAATRDQMTKACTAGADSLKKVRESMCP